MELAAEALGCWPEHIAKSLSFSLAAGPVVIVVAGDAKVDNHRYKVRFHEKAHMIPAADVERLTCKIQPFPWRIPKFPWQPAQQRPKWHQFSEFVAQLVLHRLFLCPKKARNLAKWKAQTCPPADRALTFMSGL